MWDVLETLTPLVALASNSGRGLLTTIAICLRISLTGEVVESPGGEAGSSCRVATGSNPLFYPESQGGFSCLGFVTSKAATTLAPFASQDVVGAAGGGGVHGSMPMMALTISGASQAGARKRRRSPLPSSSTSASSRASWAK